MRHQIWSKIVLNQSLGVTSGAAFSIFHFNFSGSHARAKNTACFFSRLRVNFHGLTALDIIRESKLSAVKTLV